MTDEELIRLLFHGLKDLSKLEWFTNRKMRRELLERGLITTEKKPNGSVRRRLIDKSQRLMELIQLEMALTDV